MNPFLNLQRLKVLEVKNTIKLTSPENVSDGVIVSSTNTGYLYQPFFMEQVHKVSLYKEPRVRGLMLKLGGQSLRLFMYIVYTLKKGEDIVNLPVKKVTTLLGISIPTYYKAINELCEHQVLAKQKKEYYWINPAFLFYGNKIKYFQEECPDCIDTIAIK